MKKKVCMFVWNHFTNDARVLRECTALAEDGYKVKLVAIHDHKDKNLPYEEMINDFKVVRVKRYNDTHLKLSKILKNVKKYLKNNKLLAIFMLPVLICMLPIYMVFKILKKIGLLKAMNRFCIFARMVKEGLDDKYDIYHSNDLNTLPQGYICSKIFRNSKLIYDSHEVQTSRTGYVGKQYYYLEKYLVKKIDAMIMTTDTRAQYTAELYNINKPSVVHNYPFYVDIDELEKIDLYEIANIPREEPILLYQGGIQEGRGLEKIVEAIPHINKGIVVFIGDGKLKPTIKKMVKDYGVEERVRFVEKVPVNDLLKYTRNAYLGFQVLQNTCYNHYSTISNKLLEYVMCEVPVIASDFPEIKKIVENNELGICIDSSDTNEIAKAVNMLFDIKLNNMLKNNCKYSKYKYNWNEEKSDFLQIYNKL
ncbi:glycosyltransferase [Anaeromicrobium sediminis]|uniref:Glycosyl transferase n=1 Tax=Anaeromicrobium sediminis TaxID=1478221 RepID=A0A267MFV6_9FIRM|nr:glycosyltransferase [Anaeromicrobium sediminis]PAB58272.1 glycosyl transferase [Anaeromicrobium sediminis]